MNLGSLNGFALGLHSSHVYNVSVNASVTAGSFSSSRITRNVYGSGSALASIEAQSQGQRVALGLGNVLVICSSLSNAKQSSFIRNASANAQAELRSNASVNAYAYGSMLVGSLSSSQAVKTITVSGSSNSSVIAASSVQRVRTATGLASSLVGASSNAKRSVFANSSASLSAAASSFSFIEKTITGTASAGAVFTPIFVLVNALNPSPSHRRVMIGSSFRTLYIKKEGIEIFDQPVRVIDTAEASRVIDIPVIPRYVGIVGNKRLVTLNDKSRKVINIIRKRFVKISTDNRVVFIDKENRQLSSKLETRAVYINLKRAV
tara:strand:- start:80 stop:1039 length:960 start_codon:yes stop_codon:yes gene_type:complete